MKVVLFYWHAFWDLRFCRVGDVLVIVVQFLGVLVLFFSVLISCRKVLFLFWNLGFRFCHVLLLELFFVFACQVFCCSKSIRLVKRMPGKILSRQRFFDYLISDGVACCFRQSHGVSFVFFRSFSFLLRFAI